MVFSKATTYRRANPQAVKKLWDVLEGIRLQKQSNAKSRLVKSICKSCDMTEDEASRSLKNAEEDGLLDKHGSKGGTSESYTLPDFTKPCPRLGHDWYCFVCHKPGEVISCSDCFRVYHKSCAKENAVSAAASSALSDDDDDFVCHVCELRPKCEYSRKQIRKLLEFAVHHLKKQDCWKSFIRVGYKGDICKNEYLVYHYTDLEVLQRKMKDGRYLSLEEFVMDIQILVHDVCILEGPYSDRADLVRVLLREIESEIKEVQLCTDCYINAKAKPADWISKPCKPAHELIWARQKNSQAPQYYWPAKILLERDGGFEVRFFGGAHDRAYVKKADTRPFHLPADEVGVRRGGGFERAWNEVSKLQANIDIGYYTHSSGESDLPPSDDEYTDEVYLRPLRQLAIAIAVSPAGDSSGFLPSSRGRKLSRNSSGGVPVNNRRDSSNMGSETSKKSKSKAAAGRGRKPKVTGGFRSTFKSSVGGSIFDRSSSLFSRKRGGSDTDESRSDDSDESESKEDSDPLDHVKDWASAGKKKVPSGGAVFGASMTKTKPVSRKRKAPDSVGNGSRRRSSARKTSSSSIGKRYKQDLSSTDSSEDDDDDDAKFSSPRSRNSRGRGGARRNVSQRVAASNARAKAAASALTSDSDEKTDYCCQEDYYSKAPMQTSSWRASFGSRMAPMRTPEASCLVSSSVDHLNNSYHGGHAVVPPKKVAHKSVQIQVTPPVQKVSCNCREKYERQLEEVRVRERREAERTLRELQEKHRRELDEEKTAALQKAVTEAKDANREALEREQARVADAVREAAEKEQAKQKETMETMEVRHNEMIANTKRRQWCRNCLKEAIYHCCWNTSYCSIQCQQEHWQKEHKRVCRRKR